MAPDSPGADAATDTVNDAPAARDYRPTVFLPETPFPMRAGLPQKEPEILKGWADQDLYHLMRKTRQDAGAPLFVLHDGPPYANGAIHIGHALQKTSKDFVIRSRFLLGYDVDYVPGWDCHGLPIEWKIEEQFRAKGRTKDQVSKAEFRAACRVYASEWIDVQRDAFKRLGVIGDWENRYATMDYSSEAAIVAEFHKFLLTNQLYRGSKPVMWSPVERTALADAEVEYHDHTSPTIWVKFPVREGPDVADGAAVVIWTTTPWTIPANRAISYNPDIAYAVYEVVAMEQDLAFEPWAKPGDRLIVAEKLADDVRAAAKIADWRRVDAIDPSGMECAHPLAELDEGYGFAVPLLAGDHVTDDAGTGFVHTAPGHGADDYQVWLAHGHREIPETVDADGAYFPHVPLFAGLKVLETEGKKVGKFGPANGAVMDKLIEAGTLLARGRQEHSYPHSWRSGAPVIFRNTPQWFVRMDEPIDTPVHQGRTLRETALEAIDATAFYPEAGRNRIRTMVEGRPDWLISRQRAWGSPLAMFVDKDTGQPLRDPAINARIVDRRIHADEPLRGVAEDHRGLGAPGVRIAMLQPAAGQQVASLDQPLHHGAIGRAELAGLLALGLQHLEAGEQGHMVVIGAVGIDRLRDLAVAVGQPDQIVVLTVTGRSVDKPRTRVVGHMVAGQQGHGEVVIGVQLRQGMGADHALGIDGLQARPSGDLGRAAHLVRQAVGDDQSVAGRRPGLECQAGLHGLDLINAIGDVRVIGNRPVGRHGPGGGGPDHHRRAVGRARPLAHRELDPDRGADVVVVLDLGVGQGGALHRAPHHRLGAAIELARQQELVELAHDGRFAGVVHGRIAVGPVAQHAQAAELLALDLDPAGGIFPATGAEVGLGHIVLAQALGAELLLDLPLDRQAMAVPAGDVIHVIA